ncbi:acetyltransferase [Cyclobacteriaceae bacterium YHN15]|nr:acetyltransferase [Cyclobacteriaceae bacterium YHN15]
MVVAGARGHALEVLDIFIAQNRTENLVFFDEIGPESLFEEQFPILKSEEALRSHFSIDPRFILGVGNALIRKQFYKRFTELGGKLVTIKCQGNCLSTSSDCGQADIMNLCFIGSKTTIGKGTLINTSAKIHHEVKIGDFCEIAPRAAILGKVSLGNQVLVGANVTILPNIKIGSNVKIGAGAVVTKNVPAGSTVVGVPGRIIYTNE